jgi:hypothetical protein
MKHIVTLCAAFVLAAAVPVKAQDTVAKPQGSWTTVSTPALKLSESLFNNWSSTGTSQIDLNLTFFGNYKYTHPKYVWDNIVDLGFGHAWQDLDNSAVGGRFESRRKSLDKIDLTSAISWKAYKDWGASFTANLKTQFTNGYEYATAGDNEGKLVSSFMAPGYLTTALSFEHKKDDWSISLSFLTGKTTFVFNDDLIDSARTYGVIQDKDFYLADGTTLNPARTYNHAYFALGSYLKAQYLKKDILPSLDLYARLELFYDYKKPSNMAWNEIEGLADGTVATPQDCEYKLVENEETWQDLADKNWLERRLFETDLDFELKLDYRFSSNIAANFSLNLKWDTDFSGMGKWGHLQVYQMAGLQVFFSWKSPK